jgi:small conductance mechanosensitive channel
MESLKQAEVLLQQYIYPLAWKVLGAIAVWIIGGLVVKSVQRLLDATLARRKVDPTLIYYAHNTLGVSLKALLFLAILNIFGIETTSFSAILAAAGVAIGVAWSGLLSNFAAGIFLILLRPFRVGDVITAAGVTGVVREIGLFATTIDNGENLRMFVGNNKLFSDNICNYTTNSFRVAMMRVQVASEINVDEAIEKLSAPLKQIDGISSQQEVSGEVVEVTPNLSTLVFKVPCPPSQHAAVTAEAYRRIQQTIREQKFPMPVGFEYRVPTR